MIKELGCVIMFGMVILAISGNLFNGKNYMNKLIILGLLNQNSSLWNQ